jgi:hypothetical protein
MFRKTIIAASFVAAAAFATAGTASAAFAPDSTIAVPAIASSNAPIILSLDTKNDTKGAAQVKTAWSCSYYYNKWKWTGAWYWKKKYNDCICNNY